MVKNNNPWKVADQRLPCSGPPYNDTLREAIICNDIINLALRFVHFRLPFIEITFTSDFNYTPDFLNSTIGDGPLDRRSASKNFE